MYKRQLVFILFIASDVDIVSETALLICSTSDDVILAESDRVTCLDNNELSDSDALTESALVKDKLFIGTSAIVCDSVNDLLHVNVLDKLSEASAVSVETLLRVNMSVSLAVAESVFAIDNAKA